MKHRPASSPGYSLVELLIVVVIMAMLATVSMPVYGYLRQKAAGAACIGNLRYLAVAFQGYLLDHDNIWPQCPFQTLNMGSEESEWWETTLKPYSVSRKHWICPADNSQDKPLPGQDINAFESSYLVTPFDDQPQSANRWKQPWLIERANNHGDKEGPNMLMPDGTITQGIPLPPLPR